MGDSTKEKLLPGGDQPEAGHEDVDSFGRLKSSLGRITAVYEDKKKKASQFHAGLIVNDTRAQWRKDLAETLESTPAHVFTVTLLLVDLLATAIDILKTIHNKTSDLDTCASYLESCACVDHFERSESWEFIYWISIVILSILALNVILLLVSFGPSFFKHPGYILDAFVVGTALALEIFLDAETVGLLIILTLWRIVRVAHGIFEVTDEAWEKEIKTFEKSLEDAKSKHDGDQDSIRMKDIRIGELEAAAARVL